MLRSQHRANCDYKSGSNSAKTGVLGARSGVKAHTKEVLHQAASFHAPG
jgi:hypothetical protein